MEEGDEVDVAECCKVCSTKRAVVRSGFLYCIECGLRSAESQPVLDYTFENFNSAPTKTSKRALQKNKENFSNMWSTWHAHNMILLGLVDETTMCGAAESLSGVVLRLWSRWLRYNKVAFFSKSHHHLPNLTVGFKSRDIKLLYGHQKRKAKPRDKQPYSNPIVDAKKKLTEFLKHEHSMLESQMSSAPLNSQNLEDLQYTAEISTKEIQFQPFLSKLLKNKMTAEEFQIHKEEGYCGTKCRCFQNPKKVFKTHFNRTSIFNLYVILYLGLRINNDGIHVGDLLRWCREGHLTFGEYNHFFPEDMTLKRTDRFKLSNSMTHRNILFHATLFARAFNLNGIKAPNILDLIKRYIEELELPHELFGFISRICMKIQKPPDYYAKEKSYLPNYEAIALSYIIIGLKMLFGLDGVSEEKISDCTIKCNEILGLEKCKKESKEFSVQEDTFKNFRRLFVFRDWMKYIEYRKVCLSQCHYPTKIRVDPNQDDNPDLFLFHKNKIRKTQSDGVVKNESLSIMKSLLQRIEDNYKQDIEYQFPIFSCSLTPMASNVEDLLNWHYLNSEYTNIRVNTRILEEDFTSYNISFLINPKVLKQLLWNKDFILYVHNYCPNSDINVNPNIRHCAHLQKDISLAEIVKVVTCEQEEWDAALMVEDIVKMQQECRTELNDTIVSLHNSKKRKVPQAKKRKLPNHSVDLFSCFEHYWIRHYSNIRRKFKSNDLFEEELVLNFPPSFSWLLKECANIAEISVLTLYNVLSRLEKEIIKLGEVKKKL